MKFIFGEGFQRTLGGSMMVAGTAIGAGMLALPMTSAGMWFNWSMVLMLLSWFCMLRASQAILEVNLLFEPGDSLHTLVQNTLGSFWSVLNGFSVAFVLYTLVYAYVSSGGSVVQHALQSSWGITPPRVLTSLIFTILLTACVWWSSKAVDRLSAILMGGMVITFLLSIGGMIGQARLDSMLGLDGQSGEFIFIFGAASTYLTSFCFHASVPSLIKYLGKDARTINSCLRIGTVIALLCYVVWIAAADGIIPRDDFKHITNVGDLVAASGTSLGGIILKMLEAFALFAIATSFLGAGLGLFDYMADLCGFDNSRLGRTKTMLITFVPPMIGGITWPDGFLPAIGWAGLAASIWSVIVPALLLRASRRKFQASLYRVPGGSTTVPLLLVYGIIVAVCHTLYVFNLLPVFK